MFRRTLAFGHHYDVIRVAYHLHTPSGHLLIKLIQIDICQQRGQRTSLGRAFPSSWLLRPFSMTPAFRYFLISPVTRLSWILFSQQFHQQFVVQRVEILGQIYFYGVGVALFCVFLYLAHRLLPASSRR